MGRPMRGAAVALAAAILLFAGLGRADLFNPDEPREAEIAREMWVSGDLVVPRLDAAPFLEKPPLFYWLVLGAFRLLGGPGEAAARLVPAVSGFLTVLLTYRFGRDGVGERGAALGALVLATSFQFFWTARRSMIDLPLTLAVLVACAALHRALLPEAPRRARWLALAAAAIGAAVLLKGIVGLGIPALAVAGYLTLRRGWRALWRSALLPVCSAALIPAAAWTVALGRRLGPDAVREAVWVNNVLRFTGGAAKGHVAPFTYYLPTFFTDYAPWSLVTPFAVAAALLALRRRGMAACEPLPFLVAWLGAPLVVLSIASTKRGIYLLPLAPAAALLVGWWIAPPRPAADPAGRGSRGAALGLLLALLVPLAAIVAALLVVVRPGAGVAATAVRLGPAALLAALLFAAWRAWRSRRDERCALFGAAVAGLLLLGLALGVAPEVVNRRTSVRASAEAVGRMIAAGDRLALYRFKEGALGAWLFYAGATLPQLQNPGELLRHLEDRPGPGSRPFALMRREVFDQTAPGLTEPLAIARSFAPAFVLPGDPAPAAWLQGLLPRPGEAVVLVTHGAGDGRGQHPDG